MTKEQPIIDFLKKNVQFINIGNPLSPYVDRVAVGVIFEGDVEGFKSAVFETKKRFIGANPDYADYYRENMGIIHEIKLANGNRFMTSRWGLYYVLSSDNVFNHFIESGYKIVWPDIVKLCMERGVIPFNATVLKSIEAKDDAWIRNKMAAREERKAHEAAKAEEFKRVKQELIQTLGEGLANRILGFDIFYYYSDDRVVYKSGLAREEELSEEIRKLGHDPKTILGKVRKAKAL